MAISALERLKLLGELRTLRPTTTTGSAIAKLRAAQRIREIRALLGAGQVKPEPVPEPTPAEDPRLTQLRDIAAGGMDDAALDASFAAIESAVLALNADDMLTGEAETVANAAITRWAENDERVNG